MDLADKLKKESLKKGVILGLISFILGIVFIYTSFSIESFFMFHFANVMLNLTIPIVIICIFVLGLRKAIGGYWTFSQALKHIYIMVAIGAIVSVMANFAFNISSKDLYTRYLDHTMNLTIESLEEMNGISGELDKTIMDIESQRDSMTSPKFSDTVKGLFISLLLYFILALILAAIFKKEKPIFDSPVAPEEDIN